MDICKAIRHKLANSKSAQTPSAQRLSLLMVKVNLCQSFTIYSGIKLNVTDNVEGFEVKFKIETEWIKA